MSKNKTHERIDLVGLIEHLESADEYQRRLEAEIWRLTSELEELKAELDLARGVLDHPDMERAIHKLGTVPRVITADELKTGQRVAWWSDHLAEQAVIHVGEEDLRYYSGETLVLLEDAPAEEPDPVKVGDTISTEEELDGLAHGSVVLDYCDDAHQKADGVWWEAARREERDAAGMLTHGPFTVLHLPEEDA